jgi:hypothetical protein
MNKKILILMLVTCLVLPMLSASLESLGNEFKQFDCIRISQTCASCSYVNISSITSSNSNETLVDNIAMISFGGGEWYYNFCDTEELGRYDVRGIGDIEGTDTSFAYYFKVTPSGFSGTLGFYFLIIILSAGLIVLGFAIKDGWVVALGGFGLILVGLLILFFGIDGWKDATYTWGLGIIVLMSGCYLTIRAVIEQIDL